MNKDFQVIVIGAGLSGLTCAYQAAKADLSVLLLERQDFPGRKFAASSMGKAAVSNSNINFSRFHGHDARFVSEALEAFEPVEYTASEGPKIHQHEYYGLTLAGDGPDDFIIWLTEAYLAAGGEISTGTQVVSVSEGFDLRIDGGDSVTCEKLVLACGGPNLPKLGGTLLGCDAATALGHSVRAPLAGQVGLITKEDWPAAAAGCWMDVKLSVQDGKKTIAESTGSVLFTRSGMVGQVVYNVSDAVTAMIRADKTPMLKINFYPTMSTEEVAEWMFRTFGEGTKEPAVQALDKMLPSNIGAPLLARMKLKPHARVMQLEKIQRDKLLLDVTEGELSVVDTLGIKAAETFSGGVSTREVDPRTFQSKVSDGLYLVGSMLDINADWGGFAQHFSVGSGILAGQSLAAEYKSR